MKLDEYFDVRCIDCGQSYGVNEVLYTCSRCGGLLEIRLDAGKLSSIVDTRLWCRRPFNVWRYRELLPIFDDSKIVSMGEGGTRLLRCRNLTRIIGLENLYVKCEGDNPTASFKDRGMTVGVSKALELGFKATLCASTGNTAASLSAYSARAGLKCYVLVPAGKVAVGKLSQAMVYGAKVLAIRGNFDLALKTAIQLCLEDSGIYLLNSVNPFRIEGQKTAALEIFDQLGFNPDNIVIPVGNAGNISAYWKGFNEIRMLGLTEELPRMHGVQAKGANPLVKAYRSMSWVIEPIENPETIATAIRIGSPVSWKKALRAVRESGGSMIDVSDEEILDAQKLIARMEGLFVEPASAASIAGVRRLVEDGVIDRDEVTVCIATGHGLKDPEIVLKICESPIEVDPNLEDLRRILMI
ncbi:MAG: threonine synthase [Nitrososphaerota archaeon]|nr:threonine synthase [Candidatus Bathyarchaeota archaeon]MDW8061778.1 threonine synthase [Nitrososphaerota archaeon]